MNFRKLILLGLVIGGASLSRAATILERDGTINAQCCQFAAIAINWTMDREWTNVKIEMDFHNGGDEDDVHTGVALLLDSLGPGTIPANKIDDIVLVESGAEQKSITLFQGLTLGPGTYHLVYYSVSFEFPYYLSTAWDSNPGGITTGPGVILLPSLIEGDEAPYRPASTWNPIVGHPNMFHFTGTPSEESPVPEPASMSLVAVAALAGVALRAWRLQRTR